MSNAKKDWVIKNKRIEGRFIGCHEGRFDSLRKENEAFKFSDMTSAINFLEALSGSIKYAEKENYEIDFFEV